MKERKLRFVLAKLGLEDHSRTLYVVAQGLRDAGIEVIYLGPHQTPEGVVKVAIAEDADAIGLSFHTMTYLGWVADTANKLKENKSEDICLFVGGAIINEDIPVLLSAGAKAVFPPGILMSEIASTIKEIVRKERWEATIKT